MTTFWCVCLSQVSYSKGQSAVVSNELIKGELKVIFIPELMCGCIALCVCWLERKSVGMNDIAQFMDGLAHFRLYVFVCVCVCVCVWKCAICPPLVSTCTVMLFGWEA